MAPKIGRLNLFGAKDKGYHSIEPPALLRLFIEAADCLTLTLILTLT